jgi:hypothetical protein
MAEEFGALDRLTKLQEDAKRAAAVIDAAEHGVSDKPQRTPIIEVNRPGSKNAERPEVAVTLQQDATLHPVTLSTLVRASTKKRLARASHLQAASESEPCTQWEIVDQAINEWCESRGY